MSLLLLCLYVWRNFYVFVDVVTGCCCVACLAALFVWRSRGRTASKRLALSRARWLARCFAWFRCRACICTVQSCSTHNCPQYPAVPRSTLVQPAVPAVLCNNMQYTAVPCSNHSAAQYPECPAVLCPPLPRNTLRYPHVILQCPAAPCLQ